MDFLADIGKKITETAKTVTRKSEDIVEITKLNLAVGNEEDKIKRAFYEIGSDLYKHFQEGKGFGDYFNSKCLEVKEMEENLEKLHEKILKLKGNKECKVCNAVVDLEVNFCPNCGTKIAEEPEVIIEEELKEEVKEEA